MFDWLRAFFTDRGVVHHDFPRLLIRKDDACRLCGTTVQQVWEDSSKVDCPARMNCG